LSAKHSTAFPLRRYGFIAGAATLLVVLVAWVAVRAVGPVSQDNRTPLMMQPTIPVGDTSFAPSPSASPSPSLSPSRSPSPRSSPSPSRSRSASASASASVSVSASASASPKPTPARTTSTPVPASLSARYQVGAGWDRGFVGWVQITNTGQTAATWTVKITYPSRAGVRITNVWNAQRDGSSFTGGPLAPGASASFGFEATKQVRDKISPTACTINGAPCRMG
jgi:hypothetical protein